MSAAESLFAALAEPIDAEYAQRALIVGARAREFRATLDTLVQRMVPKLEGRDLSEPSGLRAMSGRMLSLAEVCDALSVAVEQCVERDGISPSLEFPLKENATLRRAGESDDRWLRRLYGNAIRNNERQDAAALTTLDAPIDPNDTESATFADRRSDESNSDDPERDAELIQLYEQGARLIVAHLGGIGESLAEQQVNWENQNALALTVDQCSKQAIAQRLGLSRPTVSRRLQSVLEQARQCEPLAAVMRSLLQEWDDPSVTVVNGQTDPHDAEQSSGSSWIGCPYSGPIAWSDEPPPSVHDSYYRGITTLRAGERFHKLTADARELVTRKRRIAGANKLHDVHTPERWRETLQPEYTATVRSGLSA